MIVCSRLLIPSLFDEFYDNTHSYQNSTIKIVTREKIRDIVFDTSSNSIYKLEINMNENSILTEIYDGKCFNIRKYSGHLEKFSTSLSGYFSGRVQFKIPVDFLFWGRLPPPPLFFCAAKSFLKLTYKAFRKLN